MNNQATPIITMNDAHEYSLGGVRVPSVTQILGDVLGDPTQGFGKQWHLDRGSAAHALYAIIGLGHDLSRYLYDQRLQPQVDAFRAWIKAEGVEFLEVEKQVGSAQYGYAGTFDALVKMRGKKTWLIDYKASTGGRDALQLAAYAIAGGRSVYGCASLQINEDGWRYGVKLRGLSKAAAIADWHAVRRTWQIIKDVNHGKDA